MKGFFTKNYSITNNWDVPLMLLERSPRARFTGMYFKVLDLECGWFLSIKIQINYKKQVNLDGKISWKHGQTSRSTIQFNYDFLSDLTLQNLDIYLAKQCQYVEIPYFAIGSHLGQSHSHSNIGERRTTFAEACAMEVRCY